LVQPVVKPGDGRRSTLSPLAPKNKEKELHHVKNLHQIYSGLGSTLFTRQIPLVEQELPTLPEHLSSPPGF